MRKRFAAMALLGLLACMTLGGFASAVEDPVYEPGYIDWEINPNERLFVEGLDVEEAVLQRGRTDKKTYCSDGSLCSWAQGKCLVPFGSRGRDESEGF